jgi:hypothetical protein
MFSWLVDHAGLAYLLLGIVALGLASAWWMTRERNYLIGLAATAAMIFLVWLLGRLIVTDRQQIEANLWAMAQGVTDGQPDQVFCHLSRQFHFQDMDRDAFLPRAAKAIQQHRVKELYLWDFQVEQLDRQARTARMAFNVRLTSPWSDSPQFFLVRADFVLEDGQWRMKGFRLFNPVADTDRPIPVPLP